MKICSLYGAGFYYIPGTDTCIKIGGFVRAEMNFNANGSYAQYNRINFDDRVASREATRSRIGITFDTRSQTEYGTLRSYAIMAMQIDTGTPTVNPSGLGGSDVRAWSNAMFIQFAGFTAGATASFFDFDGMAYSNQTNVWGSANGGAGDTVFAYTAQLGNGLSATISAETEEGRRAYLLNATTPGTSAIPASAYGGRRYPDFVGNVRIDQAWGSAQVMGAVHNVRAGYYTPGGLAAGNPGDATGYAFGGGLKLNLPMLGKGDYIIAQANWSKGATTYAGAGLPSIGGAGASPLQLIQNGVGAGLSSAYGLATDGVFTGAAGSSIELTKAWSITGGYEHNWVPGWKTSLYGAYGKLMYSDAASAAIAATAGTIGPGGYALAAIPAGSSANWSYWQVGSRTVWTPVTNLDLSVDVMYNKMNTAFGNVAGFSDKSWFSGMFRVQRNFYP